MEISFTAKSDTTTSGSAFYCRAIENQIGFFGSHHHPSGIG
jgi:hypothetical protein